MIESTLLFIIFPLVLLSMFASVNNMFGIVKLRAEVRDLIERIDSPRLNYDEQAGQTTTPVASPNAPKREVYQSTKHIIVPKSPQQIRSEDLTRIRKEAGVE